MTPQQQTVLNLIHKLNDSEFGGWFLPSELMAFCQIESAFNPHAYRYEPRLAEGSYGLMQVLASTARSVDPTLTNPETMYDAETGLRIGMKVARLYWSQEQRHFGRDPTKNEWVASYNEGVGGAERDVEAEREPDPAYTAAWRAALGHWVAEDVDAAPAVIPPSVPSTSPTADLIAAFTAASKALQADLKARGLYNYTVDGVWGPLSQAALTLYERKMQA